MAIATEPTTAKSDGHAASTIRHRRLVVTAFVVFQVAFITTVLTWAGIHVSQRRAEWALPPLRNEPLYVPSLYDEPAVISDAQLQRVLERLVLRRHPSQLKVNHLDHGLRFWGVPARFDDPEALDGEAMRELLVDQRRFAEAFGGETDPLLINTPDGVAVRMQQGPATASHHDHTLACLAETGTPLDLPVHTAKGQTTVRALLEESLRRFRLNQIEYEWSALVYALYMVDPQEWLSSEGQRISFDRLAERLMRQDLPQGVCLAHHRLHTLVMLLRVDEMNPILKPETRASIIAFLQDATARLVASQQPDGHWNLDWPTSVTPQQGDLTTGDTVADQILATGHPLEWWALAPREVLPPRDVIARAAAWLVRTVDSLTEEQVEQYYTYLSHAGRALSLWRGQEPYEVLPFHQQSEALSSVNEKLDNVK